jgi:hypothetical protein
MVWEVVQYFLNVIAVVLAGKHELGQLSHRINNLVLVLDEIKIIQRTAFVKVRLVDEVPTRLEAKGVLDVVSEASTLSEGMIVFSASQFWLRFFQNCKLF